MYPKTLSKHLITEFLHSSVFDSNSSFNYVDAYFHDDTLGFPILMHQHSFYEINIITKGQGAHYIANKSFPANTGNVYVIPPNFEHGYYTEDPKNFKIFHILLNGLFFERYKEELSSIKGYPTLFEIEPYLRVEFFQPFYLTLSEQNLNSLLTEFNQMERLSKIKSTENNIILIAKTLYLITNICSLIIDSHKKLIENKRNTNSANSATIIKTMEYMNEHLHEKLSIEELSRKANMSKSSFMRNFKQLTKKSPIDYLMEIRIKRATVMLLSGKSSTWVAQNCGFYDSSHFNRFFLKIKGKTPRDFIKSIKK